MAEASIKLAVEGGGTFKSAMKAAESSVKLFTTELKNLEKNLSTAGKDEDNYIRKATLLANASQAAKQKLEVLSNEYTKQSQKLTELSATLDKAKEDYGEYSTEANKAQTALNNQTKVVNDLAMKMSNAQAEADKFEQELRDIGNSGQTAASQLDSAGREAQDMGDAMSNAAQKGLSFKDLLGSQIFGGLITRGIQLAVNELREFVREIIEVGSEYEAQMAKVSAISGAYKDQTGATLKELESMTRELSGYFTATEIGQAMEFEAMAGWSVDEIKTATQAILDLAQAGGVDLARASEIMTTGLNAFGLEAEDAYKYADILAVTAASAATSVDDMGAVFANVAPLAGAVGFSVEDVSVAVGILANNGMKGARAGTALQKIMQNLINPSEKVQDIFDELNITLKDEDGNMLAFEDMLTNIRKGFEDLPADKVAEYSTEIAGAGKASTAFIGLMNATADDFDNLTTAINNSEGAAAEMAKVMGDTYEGDVKRADAATQNLQKALFDLFEGPLRSAKQTFANFANGLASAIKQGSPFVKVIKDIAQGLLAFGIAMAAIKIAAFITALGGIIPMLHAIAAAFVSVNTAMGAFGLAAMAITAIVTALKIYGDTVGFAVDETTALSREISESARAMQEAAAAEKEAYEERQKAQEEQVTNDLAHLESTKMMADELLNLVDANGMVAESDRDRAEFLINQLNGALGTELSLVNGLVQGEEDLAAAIDLAIKKKEAQIYLEANEEDYIEGLKNYRQTLEDLAGAQDLLATAEQNYADAKARNQAAIENYNKAVADGKGEINEYSGELQNSQIALDEATQAWADARIAVDDLGETAKTQLTDISKYQKATADASVGDWESVIEVYELSGDKIKEMKDISEQTLKQQEETLRTQAEKEIQIYQDMYNILGESENEYDRKMLENQQARVESAIKAYSDLGNGSVDAYTSALENGSGVAEAAAIAMVTSANGAKDEASAAGAELGQALVSGVNRALAMNDWGTRISNYLIQAKNQGKHAIESASPSKLFKREIGQPIAEGIAIGIEEGKSEVTGSVLELMSAAEDEAEQSLIDTIPVIQQTAKKVGFVLENAIGAVEDIINKIDKHAAEQKAQEEFEAYQKKREEKQKELEKAEVKDRQKILDEITKLDADWNKKQRENNRKELQNSLKDNLKVLEEISKEYEKAWADLEKKRDSFAEKMMNYGDLFTKDKNEEGVEIFKLADLEQDIEKIKEYGNALEDLQLRGVSESLLSEILGMNIDDATAYMGQLLSMTDEKYNEYMTAWETKQKLSKDIANKFYKDEMQELSQNMLDTLGEFTEDFELTGEYLMDGVADGIKAGKSEIVKSVRDVLEAGLREAKTVMGIASPSKVMAQVGRFMAQGLDIGFVSEMQKTNNDIAAAMLKSKDSVTNTGIMRATEAAVNGINAGQMLSTANGQPVYVNVILDGRQIAQAVFDPLKSVSKQRGQKI